MFWMPAELKTLKETNSPFFFSSVADWNPGMNFGGFWPLWTLVALFAQPGKSQSGSARSVCTSGNASSRSSKLSQKMWLGGGWHLPLWYQKCYMNQTPSWFREYEGKGLHFPSAWKVQGRRVWVWSDCNRTARGSPVFLLTLFHGISVLPNKRK